MKKLFLLVTTLFTMLVLVACGGGGTTTTTTKTGSTSSTTQGSTSSYWDKDGNGVEDWQEEEITLRYATWQHTSEDAITIDSLLVEAFMERYPNITVEMQIVGYDTEWFARMSELIETNELPDVFLVNRLAEMLPLNMLGDITDYFDNDPDTQYIFESVRNLNIYNDVRYGVPTFIYPQLWIVNLDVLSRAGIPTPTYSWTLSQMEAIAQATYNENTNVVGQYGCQFYYREYPKALKMLANPTEGRRWYATSFDGTQFNYDDPVMLQAFNHVSDITTSHACTVEYSAEQLTEYYNDPAYDPRYNGKVAIWRQPSWEAKNYFNDFTFNWDVFPAPAAQAGETGVAGGNLDIGSISSTTEHPEAAYQLLKWMSFGEEGLVKRYELFKEYNEMGILTLSGNNYPFPVADYGLTDDGENRVWDNIPYTSVKPGFTSPEFIESLKIGAYQANKEFVGWDEADTAAYNYLYNATTGAEAYADVYRTLQEQANAAMQQAIDALNSILDII